MDVSTQPLVSPPEITPRQGASLGFEVAEQPALGALGTSEMPMIVWLRGDEEMVQDFCLDAEAVMQALGIKRSRLTQIAGRELRVGRLRSGRYTRPVFRLEDVEAYRNWTRAPATHQRSSSVLEEAASKLEIQAEDLHNKIAEDVSKLSRAIGEDISAIKLCLDESSRSAERAVRTLSEETRTQFLHTIHTSNEHVTFTIDSFKMHLTTRLEAIERALQDRSATDQIAYRLVQMEDLMQKQRKETQSELNLVYEQVQRHQEFYAEATRALALGLQFHREQLKKLGQLQQESNERANMSTESAPPIAPQENPSPVRYESIARKHRMPYGLRRRMARTMK